jgi:hypothetical protein
MMKKEGATKTQRHKGAQRNRSGLVNNFKSGYGEKREPENNPPSLKLRRAKGILNDEEGRSHKDSKALRSTKERKGNRRIKEQPSFAKATAGEGNIECRRFRKEMLNVCSLFLAQSQRDCMFIDRWYVRTFDPREVARL